MEAACRTDRAARRHHFDRVERSPDPISTSSICVDADYRWLDGETSLTLLPFHIADHKPHVQLNCPARHAAIPIRLRGDRLGMHSEPPLVVRFRRAPRGLQ
jgi:hypothetical protein